MVQVSGGSSAVQAGNRRDGHFERCQALSQTGRRVSSRRAGQTWAGLRAKGYLLLFCQTSFTQRQGRQAPRHDALIIARAARPYLFDRRNLDSFDDFATS